MTWPCFQLGFPFSISSILLQQLGFILLGLAGLPACLPARPPRPPGPGLIPLFLPSASSQVNPLALDLGGPGTCHDDAATFIGALQAELGSAQHVLGGTEADLGTSPLSVLHARTDLDFTERLWGVIKAADSLADLKRGMGLVFDAVRRGIVQPILHRSNTSRLATVARECLKFTHGGDSMNAGQLQDMLACLCKQCWHTIARRSGSHVAICVCFSCSILQNDVRSTGSPICETATQ